jgi:hypothetical protein
MNLLGAAYVGWTTDPRSLAINVRSTEAKRKRLFVTCVTARLHGAVDGEYTNEEATMFSITQSNTQVYSVFGSFVVEQRETEHLQRHIDRLPRADVAYGSGHPLAAQQPSDQR